MKQNKFNVTKISKCRRCKQMINMGMKWLMPDEKQTWVCDNCHSEYIMTSFCFGQDNTQIIRIVEQIRNFETSFELINNKDWRLK